MSSRHLSAPLVLAEEPVQPTLLSHEADEDDDGDEGEGGGGLPDLHPVRGVDHEDDQQPHVGEHGEDHRDAEHRERLDLPRLSVWNHHHAASKQTVRERQGS